MDCSLPWDSPGKNTRGACHSLLPGIFSRDWTWVSRIAGGFSTVWTTREAKIIYLPVYILESILDNATSQFLWECSYLIKMPRMNCERHSQRHWTLLDHLFMGEEMENQERAFFQIARKHSFFILFYFIFFGILHVMWESNPCSLLWKCGILTIRQPEVF